MIDAHIHEDVICVHGTTPNRSSVYVFLVDGMLVDTGPQIIQDDLVSFYNSSPFEIVVLTHSHEDHVGTAAWIDQHRGAPIFIHPSGVEACSNPPSYPKYRQIAWGIIDGFTARPLRDVVESKSHDWRVIYTPGHANDHVALLNEETGRLFSGDLFLAPKTKVILGDESIPVMMNSIRTVLACDFQSMFCCHAGYVPDGKTMLQAKLDDLENLCGQVIHLYSRGLSLDEINEEMFPKKYPIVLVSDGEFDSKHIVRSILHHHDIRV